MVDTSKKFKFLIPILSGLLAVIFVLCGSIYIIFNINLFEDEKIPIIKAPEGFIKEKPKNSGGKIIDHLDAEVYGILDKDIDEKIVEVIKPPTPEPELPSVELGLKNLDIKDNKTSNSEDIEENIQFSSKNKTKNLTESSKKGEIPSDLSSKIKDKNNISKLEENQNENLSKTVDIPILKPTKGYFVQLASFNDEKKANLSVDILNEKLAVSLDGNSLEIMAVDLGLGKGIWWRVVTSILSRSKAETICALLKSEGNNCIVRSK